MGARRSIALAALLVAVGGLAAGCSGSSPRPAAIVFVSSRDGDYALFGMDADGSHQHRLTRERGDPSTPAGAFFQVTPAWSPDGRLIAFSSRRTGRSKIYVMNADGTGTKQLTFGAADDTDPTWSPDGKRIAFVRGRRSHLAIMDADGKGARRIGRDPAVVIEPAWSPDGRWIVYVRELPSTPVRELELVHPDGTGRRQLTYLAASVDGPAWSPDSKRIVFASDEHGQRFQLYSIGVDGKGLRRVSTAPENEFDPAWSPSGRTLAFARGGAIVTQTGGAEAELTSPKDNDSSPIWNPRPPRR